MKTKILAFLLIALCGMTPFAANASVSPQSLDLFAVISNALQGLLASIGPVVAKNNIATTTAQNKLVSTSITLELGDKSVIVAILQKELIAKDYLKEPPTGVFDVNTQMAVKAFQKAENLPVTGYVQVATSSLASVFAAAATPFAPIKIGATGAQASALQNILIKKGNLKISTTTAYFGTLTQTALKAFQASHGLPQTGIVDQATFAAMNGK